MSPASSVEKGASTWGERQGLGSLLPDDHMSPEEHQSAVPPAQGVQCSGPVGRKEGRLGGRIAAEMGRLKRAGVDRDTALLIGSMRSAM